MESTGNRDKHKILIQKYLILIDIKFYFRIFVNMCTE